MKLCLTRRPSIQVVGEAGNGSEALALAGTLLPDVVLMDIDMPMINGLAVTELLRRQLPDTKVLILSMHIDADYQERVTRAGAHGMVSKSAPPEVVIQAIEAVHAGRTYFPGAGGGALPESLERGPTMDLLSIREREVLAQIARGLLNKEIADRLGLSVRTVESHRERIMEKLGIHTVAGLTKFAVAKGLTPLAAEERP